MSDTNKRKADDIPEDVKLAAKKISSHNNSSKPSDHMKKDQMLTWNDSQWSQWKSVPKYSERIPGSKFVVAKTPLSTLYELEFGVNNGFAVDDLLQEHIDKSARIGLFVNTMLNGTLFRLHQSGVFADWDLDYKALTVRQVDKQAMDRARFVAPTKQEIKWFVERVHEFWTKHPKQIVVVASTLGFNRAGTFVVAFFVEKLGCPLKQALEKFAQVRAPGVYAPECLERLHEMYDPSHRPGVDELTKALDALPVWDASSRPVFEEQIKAIEEHRKAQPQKVQPTKPTPANHQTQRPAPESDPSIPKPWRKEWSKRAQRFYYFHPDTKKSVWSVEECK